MKKEAEVKIFRRVRVEIGGRLISKVVFEGVLDARPNNRLVKAKWFEQIPPHGNAGNIEGMRKGAIIENDFVRYRRYFPKRRGYKFIGCNAGRVRGHCKSWKGNRDKQYFPSR